MMKDGQAQPRSPGPIAREGTCELDQVDSCKVSDARATLPPETELRRAADAFRVLANPNRLRALKALQGRELCVCDLREVLGISMSGTSQVLRELRNLGAVEFRAEGKLAYYRLADRFWLQVAEGVLKRFAAVKPT
jgi:DNA-binding transcriptional ArsR family regulator